MFHRDNTHKFQITKKMSPTGDQPQAIKKLTKGVKDGTKSQILLGATGTGKTFTIANVIKNCNKPVLLLAHNKTLVGQDYESLKKMFPHNHVGYFVSYYDYYRPEAYVPSTDTYIEKDDSINDDIDELRHAATNALLTSNDVIIVASVSSIFGLGSPENYFNHIISLKVGQQIKEKAVLKKLVADQFVRNDLDFERNCFRVHGDIVDIFPSSAKKYAYRIEFFGDEIDRIDKFVALTGQIITHDLKSIAIFPATHFLTQPGHIKSALKGIRNEMVHQVAKFRKQGKIVEAQRLKQRTIQDIEMIKQTGYVNGIENYSRWFDGRTKGEPPYTLLDFFPKDSLIILDESHQTLPQIAAMRNGDKARKKSLIDYGFRLPSALDNRPLTLQEFEKHVNQIIYMSATPGKYELAHTNPKNIAEQVIRPTGLLDPKIDVRPSFGQIDDLIGEINKRVKKHQRVFITTLTKKMAEDLADYLRKSGVRAKYLHSGIKTLKRTKLLHDLRVGKFDVLIGINLLREGIDIPEVSLIAILDADKEGFLRNPRSLVQTIGRASRNKEGEVIMYGDTMTDSMKQALDENDHRRSIQIRYNIKHHIKPRTIKRPIEPIISPKKNNATAKHAQSEARHNLTKFSHKTTKEQKSILDSLRKQMKQSAKKLAFHQASQDKREIQKLKKRISKKHYRNHRGRK